MEHPLIGDLSGLSLEELQTKITELNRKLSWALRHNSQVARQVQMALESYRAEHAIKQRALWDRENQGGTDYSDRIDIS